MFRAFLTTLLLGSSSVQEAAPTPTIAIELPPGPLRDTVSKLDPAVEPAAPPDGFGAKGTAPGLAAGALLDAATWARWNAALSALHAVDGAGGRGAASPRAVLALVALEQGRFRDANGHLAHVAAEPALFAALLPRFVPGVPAGTPLARGGRSTELADGCVLSPALPPASTEPGVRRATIVRGLAVGGARVDFTLSVEHEGVQAELGLSAGERARVGLVLPRVEDYSVGAEYVDWEKQPVVGAPLFVEAKASEEPHVLFARFETKDLLWPTRLPDVLPASVAESGLWIVLDAKDPERERWAKIAAALALPKLGIDCRLAPLGAPPPGGITIDLVDVSTRPDKLAWLVSALERFVLRAR